MDSHVGSNRDPRTNRPYNNQIEKLEPTYVKKQAYWLNTTTAGRTHGNLSRPIAVTFIKVADSKRSIGSALRHKPKVSKVARCRIISNQPRIIPSNHIGTSTPVWSCPATSPSAMPPISQSL